MGWSLPSRGCGLATEKKRCLYNCYAAFAYVFASTCGFVATLACASGVFNAVAKVFGFILTITHAWSWHCICKQIHAGDIAVACTGVPLILPTFIPTKNQPKKIDLLVYSTYNRMINFHTKLHSLAREYEDTITAHKDFAAVFTSFMRSFYPQYPSLLYEGV